MSTINRTTVTDLRGAARLAVDATLGITTLVEKMHHTIQLVHPPLGASRAESTRGLTGLIYRSIRGTTRVIGKGLDAGLTPVAALLPAGVPTAARNAWVSAINGVYGDHLERTANPLAIDMSFLHAGDFLDPERPGDVVQDASGKVLLAIHGLCLNEQHWSRDGHHRMANVAEKTGHTLVQLRYNSGRSIDANGSSLAEMLEALLQRWPVPVTQLVIVGHSMGGLVARSAIRHGTAAGHSWRGRLRKLFSLGTPHHGAPLERGGNRLDYVMELSPYVAPFTSLGKARSAGITDLRYGSITSVEQAFVALPEDIECYALAATLGKRRGLVADRLIGDGLVPLDSALGRHPDAGRTLAIPKSHQWIGYEMGHLELLGRPEVYSQLEQWLR
ncbi:MAG: esterase/lipase family protein [Steroidobacteraceae bacterium]